MEPEHTPEEVLLKKRSTIWNTVTPLSKYLALALFVALPFIGGYVGYFLSPEKVVEVVKVVEIETKATSETNTPETITEANQVFSRTYQVSDTFTLKEYNCPNKIDITQVCFDLTNKQESIISNNLNEMLRSQGEFMVLNKFGASSEDKTKLYFTAYVPETDGGDVLVELDLDSLQFSSIDFSDYNPFERDVLSFPFWPTKSGAVIARATSSGKMVEVFDVETRSVVMSKMLAEGETLFGACTPIGPGFSISYFTFTPRGDLVYAVFDANELRHDITCGDVPYKILRYDVIYDAALHAKI